MRTDFLEMKTIETERLLLITADKQILLADITDHTELGNLLSSEISNVWPPTLFDTEVMQDFIRIMDTKSDRNIRIWYWVLKRGEDMPDILIGSGGIISHTEQSDTVIIGYSVLEEFQNQGYATEAITSLIPIIFSISGVKRILATTYPYMKASIRILEKNGFIQISHGKSGEGIEEGTLTFIRIHLQDAEQRITDHLG